MNKALSDFVESIIMIKDYCDTWAEEEKEILRELRNFLVSSKMNSDDIIKEVKEYFEKVKQ